MYTLPQQCEFLSDEWIEEAERFLNKEIKQRAPEPFSVSGQYQDAPPHLAFPDNVAKLLIRYDGDQVCFDRSCSDDADLAVTADYQAYLMVAQTVGALAPGVVERAHVEAKHWFGDDAIIVKGSINPSASRAMSLLADHMARRTVENPDLAHRAARQGLSGNIREQEELGYTVIENAITPTLADIMRDKTIQAVLPHTEQSMQWMLYQGVEFERLLQNPLLMTLIDASLGRGAVMGSITSIIRGPGRGLVSNHNDYSQVPEPYPDFSLTGVGVWSFEDWTVSSGPTWIVPGSHKLRRQPQPGEKAEGVPIEMPIGSVVWFHQGVWHWQGDRTDPGERVTLHAHFNRGILRSLEPKTIDQHMLHRNSPRLAEMLGEHDWFDKVTPKGRDHLRMMHMINLNRFTTEQKQVIMAEG
jgi:ectoine hydroxylase-related dioxygenase (phytanoyl-CoA dioxygenase family)